MKNLNSISNVKAAIEYEIERQADILDGGAVQETRRWDVDQAGFSLRSKEEAHDYRYFPDPDLMPVQMDRARIAELKAKLPERPFDKQRRFEWSWGCPIRSPRCSAQIASSVNFSKLRWRRIIRQSLSQTTWPTISSESSPEPRRMVSRPRRRVEADSGTRRHARQDYQGRTISKQIAKEVFTEMFATGEMPDVIVDRKGLKQAMIRAKSRRSVAKRLRTMRRRSVSIRTEMKKRSTHSRAGDEGDEG